MNNRLICVVIKQADMRVKVKIVIMGTLNDSMCPNDRIKSKTYTPLGSMCPPNHEGNTLFGHFE